MGFQPAKRRTFHASEAELSRVSRVKTISPRAIGQLGPEMIDFFKQSVQKRQGKLVQLAACWERLVPSTLIEHCALESLHRGTLIVLVDSSSHLYELKQLLLAGLQQQLTIACKFAGLKKIALKPGRWYEATENGEKKLRF
jgi:Dna[CI] antecedent DciA-like protein